MTNYPVDDNTLNLLRILSLQTATLLNEHQSASVERKRAIIYEIERLRLKRQELQTKKRVCDGNRPYERTNQPEPPDLDNGR